MLTQLFFLLIHGLQWLTDLPARLVRSWMRTDDDEPTPDHHLEMVEEPSDDELHELASRAVARMQRREQWMNGLYRVFVSPLVWAGHMLSAIVRLPATIFRWIFRRTSADVPATVGDKWELKDPVQEDLQEEELAVPSGFRWGLGVWLLFLLSPLSWLSEQLDRVGKRPERPQDDQRLAAQKEREDRQLKQRLIREQATLKTRQDVAQSPVTALGNVVLWPVRNVSGFLWALVSTRSLGQWSLIATLVLASLGGGFAYLMFTQDPDRLTKQYEKAVDEALEEENFDAADLYRQKLEQLGLATSYSELRSALAWEDAGDSKRAYEMMTKLSERSGREALAAHHWLVTRLMQETPPDPEIETPFQLAQHHLDQLRSSGQLPAEVDLLQSILWLRQGNMEAADKLLSERAETMPDAAYALLDVRVRAGDPVGIQEILPVARRHLARTTRLQTELEHQAAAQIKQLEKDFSGFETVVAHWSESNPESRVSSYFAAMLALEQMDHWLSHPSESAIESVAAALSESLTGIPDSEVDRIHARLARLWQQRSTPQGAQFLETLESLRPGNAFVLEFLGSAYAGQGDWAKAKSLLERSAELRDDWGTTLNNLAHVLMEVEPRELERARELAGKAVALKPDDPRYRMTRAQVHLELEQWEKAIPDLEMALNGLGDRPDIHQRLADAYRKLGNDRLAEIHRRAAGNLP